MFVAPVVEGQGGVRLGSPQRQGLRGPQGLDPPLDRLEGLPLLPLPQAMVGEGAVLQGAVVLLVKGVVLQAKPGRMASRQAQVPLV